MLKLNGIKVSSGIATGKAFKYLHKDVSNDLHNYTKSDIEGELAKLDLSLSQSKKQLKSLLNKVGSDSKNTYESVKLRRELIQMQINFMDDDIFINEVKKEIQHGLSAIEAVSKVLNNYVQTLKTNGNALFSDRTADIRDIEYKIINNIIGVKNELECINEEIILVADELTPTDTMYLKRNKVLGIATNTGGLTSHTAILARSMDIPAVLGLKTIYSETNNGDTVIIDGSKGCVIINPDDQTAVNYKHKIDFLRDQKIEIEKYRKLPPVTADGKKIILEANIGDLGDVEKAYDSGAEGIGLMRSEFLYIGRYDLPTEQEQFEAYKYTVETMKGKCVTIRTFDIGGDKDFPYFGSLGESNPYLGLRGIRFCLNDTGLFKIQLKAILRSSAFGNVRIMLPMISDVNEVIAVRKIIDDVKADLLDNHVPFSENVPLGIMVEVPSAALNCEQFIDKVDFFSIGTNDLTQYTLAVDRSNVNVSKYYKPLHSSVIKLIEMVRNTAKKYSKSMSLCGELATFKEGIYLLLKIGLDRFSVSPTSIPEVVKYIRNISVNHINQEEYK